MEGKVFFVTKEKLKQLEKEHEELVTFERNKTIGVEAPKVLESEDMNPEFISYHEDMDSLRSRIIELKNILENHKLIKRPLGDRAKFVDVGAKVKVDANGKASEFTIVGTLEADPNEGKISNESPVGRALLGLKVGDEFVVNSPKKKTYKVRDIKYKIS